MSKEVKAPSAEMKLWRREGSGWEREPKVTFDILSELPIDIQVKVQIYAQSLGISTTLHCRVEGGARESDLAVARTSIVIKTWAA